MERPSLLVLMAALLLPSAGHTADAAWQTVRNEQGIEVATREVAGSRIAESRAVVRLSGVSVAAVVAVLRDIPQQSRWVESVDESRTLATLSPEERINYTLSKAPWPVADRDAVVRSRVTAHADGGITIESHAEPDYMPAQPGVVRVSKVDSRWQVTPLESGEVEVRYQVHSEPGGSLPAWLINRVVYEQPFKTLLRLRDYLAHTTKE